MKVVIIILKRKELDVQPIDQEMQNVMTPYMVKAYQTYNSKFADLNNERLNNLATKFSPIRFNRYKKELNAKTL